MNLRSHKPPPDVNPTLSEPRTLGRSQRRHWLWCSDGPADSAACADICSPTLRRLQSPHTTNLIQIHAPHPQRRPPSAAAWASSVQLRNTIASVAHLSSIEKPTLQSVHQKVLHAHVKYGALQINCTHCYVPKRVIVILKILTRRCRYTCERVIDLHPDRC